jgi:preprotein translocase subunit SecG
MNEDIEYRKMDMDRQLYVMRKSEREKSVKLMLTMTSIFMMIFIVFMLYIKISPYYTERMQLENDKLRLEVEGLKKIPNLEEKISILEKQTRSLTTDNIENRLLAIEQAIKKGEINPKDIQNVQELNLELNKLKSYLFEDTDAIIEFKTLQKNYQDLKNNQDDFMDEDDIKRELNFMQNTLLICIAIFGILATIFATSWFVGRRKGKEDKGKTTDNKA